ncbi:hypothetical protein, partial [Oceanidesulfovibrio indonesiensis]|uniref:hypothetical protein n=1 Tax=Oceanidesulfovibrio indonesiensis TaxID=54767 RepID=UPI001186B032
MDGTEHVRFDKPVVGWLNNFLDFPVGTIVPSGYYDREKAVWVPSENGLVVQLLDTDGDGIVDALDATGDGEPDDIDGDDVLGDEVAGLEDSSIYAPGAIFWRVRMEHFSPWDWNWPWNDYLPPSGDFDPAAIATPPSCDDCPQDGIAS